MKLLFRIILVMVFILVVFYGAVNFIIAKKGKELVAQKIEEAVHMKTTVGYVRLEPLLNIKIGRINIENTLKAEAILIKPSIFESLSKVIVLRKVKIYRPQFNYEIVAAAAKAVQAEAAQPPSAPALAKPAVTPAPVQPAVTPAPAKPAVAPASLRFWIKHLYIDNGAVELIDHAVSDKGVRVKIEDINLEADNIYSYPVSAITNFHLSGRIPWKEQGKVEGKLDLEGWANFMKKDVQASFKILDIDAICLYPYYSNWVNLEKARIDKAKLNFTSEIQGRNNDITADCHLELDEIVFRPRTSDEPQEKAERIAFAVLDIFRGLNNGKVVLDFRVKTKLDSPKFSFMNIRGAFEEKLTKAREGESFKPEDVLIFPAKLIGGTVKGATDITKGVINSTISAGREIKDAIEGTFKKEPASAPSIANNSQPAPQTAPQVTTNSSS